MIRGGRGAVISSHAPLKPTALVTFSPTDLTIMKKKRRSPSSSSMSTELQLYTPKKIREPSASRALDLAIVPSSNDSSSSSFTLPKEWIVEKRRRTSGLLRGTIDTYYLEPGTGRKLRSFISVKRYLTEPGRYAITGSGDIRPKMHHISPRPLSMALPRANYKSKSNVRRSSLKSRSLIKSLSCKSDLAGWRTYIPKHQVNIDKSKPLKLPAGWFIRRVTRTSGQSMGRVDKYYCERATGLVFRSKLDVLRYLADNYMEENLTLSELFRPADLIRMSRSEDKDADEESAMAIVLHSSNNDVYSSIPDDVPLKDLVRKYDDAPRKDRVRKFDDAPLEDRVRKSNDVPIKDLFGKSDDVPLKDLVRKSDDVTFNDRTMQSDDVPLKDLVRKSNDVPIKDLFGKSNDVPIKDLFGKSDNIPLKDIVRKSDDVLLDNHSRKSGDIPLNDHARKSDDVPLKDLVRKSNDVPIKDLFGKSNDVPIKDLFGKSDNVPLKDIVRKSDDVLLDNHSRKSGDMPLNDHARKSDDMPLQDLVQESDNVPLKDLVQESDHLPLEDLVQEADDMPLDDLVQEADDVPLKDLVQETDDVPLKDLVQEVDDVPLKNLVQKSSVPRKISKNSDKLSSPKKYDPSSATKTNTSSDDLPNQPVKIKWVLSGAGGDAWSPFVSDTIVAESLKQEWTQMFIDIVSQKHSDASISDAED